MRKWLCFLLLILPWILFGQDSTFFNLDDALSNPGRVKTLELHKQKLTSVPSIDFDRLKNLRSIDLSANEIQTIDFDDKGWSSISTLRISSNRMEELSDGIANLIALEELDLSGNDISFLPENISKLKNLRRLILHSNEIFELPKGMDQLTKLEYLDLRNNRLQGWTKKKIKALFKQPVKVKLSSDCNC